MKRFFISLLFFIGFIFCLEPLIFNDYNFVRISDGVALSSQSIVGVVLSIFLYSMLSFVGSQTSSKKIVFTLIPLGLTILGTEVLYAMQFVSHYHEYHLALWGGSAFMLFTFVFLHKKLQEKPFRRIFSITFLCLSLGFSVYLSIPKFQKHRLPSEAELVLKGGSYKYYRITNTDKSVDYINQPKWKKIYSFFTLICWERSENPYVGFGTWERYDGAQILLGTLEGRGKMLDIIDNFTMHVAEEDESYYNELSIEEEEDESQLDEKYADSQEEVLVDYYSGTLVKDELNELVKEVRLETPLVIKGAVDLSYSNKVIKSFQEQIKNDFFSFNKHLRGVDTIHNTMTYAKGKFLEHCSDYLFDILLRVDFAYKGAFSQHNIKSNFYYHSFKGETPNSILEDEDREYDIKSIEASYIIENLSRDPEEIQYLFDTYKDYLIKIIPPALYRTSGLKYTINNLLVAFRGLNSKQSINEWADGVYFELMEGNLSPDERRQLLESYASQAFIKQIDGSFNYFSLPPSFWYNSFWVRRFHEGNIDTVLTILYKIADLYGEYDEGNRESADILSREINAKAFVIGANVKLLNHVFDVIGEVKQDNEVASEVTAVSVNQFSDSDVSESNRCDAYYYVKIKTENQEGWVDGRKVYRVCENEIYKRFTFNEQEFQIHATHYFGERLRDLDYTRECLEMRNPIVLKNLETGELHLVKKEDTESSEFPYLELDLYKFDDYEVTKASTTKHLIILNMVRSNSRERTEYSITINKTEDGSFTTSSY